MPRNIIAAVAVLCVAEGVLMTATPKADHISARARKLHFASLVVDTHDDTTQRFLDGGFDLGARSDAGSIDSPSIEESGLGAIFFSIWIRSKMTGPEAIKHALDQIDAVREQVRRHPNDIVLAATAAEVREARKQGKIAALMGVEGGHMIANDLSVLRSYAGLGVRYMTLTHSGNDEWADSSTDTAVHKGHTNFCKNMVREKNHHGLKCGMSPIRHQPIADRYEVYTQIVENIDRGVKVVGGVNDGVGYDFDGGNMAFGMEDATKLPQITEALLRKGYSEEDVRKILGENTLRVMTEVERVSRELSSGK